MHLLNFIYRFPGDIECLLYYKKIRENVGVECLNCGGRRHIWNERLDQFRCAKCETMIHIKTGTAMEKSALSIKFWFLAAYLLTCEDEAYSVSEVLKKMDYLKSEEVHAMLSKLESLIKKADTPLSFDMLLQACARNN